MTEDIGQLRERITFARAQWIELEKLREALPGEISRAMQTYHSLCAQLRKLEAPAAATKGRAEEIADLEKQLAELRGV